MYIPENLYILVDIFVILLFALCLFIGYKKGFLYQLADLLSFVIAFIAAWFLGPILAEHVKIYVANETLMDAIIQPLFNNLIWFIIVLVIVKIIFALILPLFKTIKAIPIIGSVNAVGGLITGAINGFIWVTIFGLLLLTPLFENGSDIRERSIYKPFNAFSDKLITTIGQKIDDDLIAQGFEYIDEYREAFDGWLVENGIFKD